MGTDEIRKHLEGRLRGTYSEAELDAIAASLEADPDLLTPVEDPPWDPALTQAGLADPTGTILTIPDIGLDFRFSREHFEELAGLMSSEDPIEILARMFPPAPTPEQGDST